MCPECGTDLIKRPGCRLVREGGPSFNTFSMKCLRCGYQTETVKIREDYLNKKSKEIEDVTPYKDNFLKRLIKK
jgi:ribosomal protein L37E